jgi:hypothetical protein
VELVLRQAFGPLPPRLVQTGTLTVSQGAVLVQQIPTLGSVASIFLALSLMCLASMTIRKRRLRQIHSNR